MYIAENPPCALRSRKLFFFLQFCALLSFDILTRRTKDTDVYSIHHHPIWFFRSIEYTMWRFYEGKKDRIDKLLTPCKYLEIQHKETKKRCQDDSISQFILLKLIELKSVNLQYNTLVCWANGTNDSSTNCLTFQVFLILQKNKKKGFLQNNLQDFLKKK